MRLKFWVFLNVLIIPTSTNAEQNFALKGIVNLILFGQATCKKMVQILGSASSQYSNLYIQPYSVFILPGEKYARLAKTIIKNY